MPGMVKKSATKKEKTLNDKLLARLNKPKQGDFDIEDETIDTRNDNSDSEKEEDETVRDHYVDVGKSKLRGDTLEVDGKYVGAKVGRSELFNDELDKDDQDKQSEDEELDNADSENSDGNGDSDGDSVNVESEDDEGDQFGGDSELENKQQSDESDGEGNDETYKRNQIAKLLDSEKKQILSRLSTSAKSDALKGYTILRQGAEYDRILDARIKLQKGLLLSNKLPIDAPTFKKFQTKKSNHILEETEEKLYGLIERLIRVRTNQLEKDGLVKEPISVNLSNKRKLDEYLDANENIDNAVTPITKSVITKWSNRVQSASGLGALNQGKFKVINQNVWSQISNQLDDTQRLIKKTKINRRNVKPMGYVEEVNEKSDSDVDSDVDAETAGLSNIDKSLQTNEYIFDDDDFYRLLLNDMINKKLDQKQSTTSAVLMLSKNKMQKNYDRMATKGRKLKYTTQDPLVQYEIPRRKYYSWNDEQIDELFAGLFGMKFDMDDNDDSDMEDEQQEEDVGALRKSGVKLFG